MGVATGLVLPWLAFTLNAGLLSFSTHFRHPQLCWLVVALGAAGVAGSGASAALAGWRRHRGDASRDFTWQAFVFVALALGWGLGLLLGSLNYSLYMERYYDIASLAMYPSVDPAKVSGQQVMDAGRVVFSRGSRVDASLAGGFSSGQVYCAAPVVPAGERLASYDFWVVGTGCCTGTGEAFVCGGPLLGQARAGLRLLDDGQAQSFRLAVQQAEVAHHIYAGHPLFFHLTEDPLADMAIRQDRGVKTFLLAVLCFLGLQTFGVIVVATLGTWRQQQAAAV